jgi:hypothetical protein
VPFAARKKRFPQTPLCSFPQMWAYGTIPISAVWLDTMLMACLLQ